MKDRNIQFLFQPLLDLKAPWRRYIFEIDSAETDGDVLDRLNYLMRVLGVEADREGVHAAEFLKELCFALHNGHCRRGPDVAKPEHGSAIRDNRDRVLFDR